MRATPCRFHGQLPYLVLLRVGFTLPPTLPSTRCALTAPFHPYLDIGYPIQGGLFSVALSVGSRPPGITWHPALGSPDFPLPRWIRCSDCLSDSRHDEVWHIRIFLQAPFRRGQDDRAKGEGKDKMRDAARFQSASLVACRFFLFRQQKRLAIKSIARAFIQSGGDCRRLPHGYPFGKHRR